MEQNTQNKFLEIFQNFAQEINHPGLEFDENGNCEILFGDDLVANLHLDEELGEVLVYGQISDIVGIPKREEFLAQILRANYFWMDTRGFTISLSQDDDDLLLAIGKEELAFFDSADKLSAYLDAFVELVFQWRQKVYGYYHEELLQECPEADADNSADNSAKGDAQEWMKI